MATFQTLCIILCAIIKCNITIKNNLDKGEIFLKNDAAF